MQGIQAVVPGGQSIDRTCFIGDEGGKKIREARLRRVYIKEPGPFPGGRRRTQSGLFLANIVGAGVADVRQGEAESRKPVQPLLP